MISIFLDRLHHPSSFLVVSHVTPTPASSVAASSHPEACPSVTAHTASDTHDNHSNREQSPNMAHLSTHRRTEWMPTTQVPLPFISQQNQPSVFPMRDSFLLWELGTMLSFSLDDFYSPSRTPDQWHPVSLKKSFPSSYSTNKTLRIYYTYKK